MDRRTFLASTGSVIALTACQNKLEAETSLTEGRIEKFDDGLDALIDTDAEISLLADGFKWTEGPAWDFSKGHLYFSDIPNNRIHTWDSKSGLGTFLDPAGRAEEPADPHASPGTNGIWYLAGDKLLICNQSARSVDLLDLSSGSRRAIVSSFRGKALNSPNDISVTKSGAIAFTDPPYGLKGGNASEGKAQPHNGVYLIDPDGNVSLITDKMTFPNGVAHSPDEQTLYATQSDPEAALVRRFNKRSDGTYEDMGVWQDFTSMVSDELPGLPDGMDVDQDGNVFITGPGGVLIVSPEGTLLGRINTGRATANCAFGEDGRTLFMTATDTLLSIQTKTRGKRWG